MESTSEQPLDLTVGFLVGVFFGLTLIAIFFVFGRPLFRLFRSKSRRGIALSAILFGWLGVHRFKLGNKKQGFITLAITIASIVPFVPGGIIMFFIGVFEGIRYLRTSDDDFERIYRSGEKKWF